MTDEKKARQAYRTVGELILIASALDDQLNHICISVLGLAQSPMLESVVASLDSARKVEILKAYASKITAAKWKEALMAHAEAVEKVNRARNLATHGVMSFYNGEPVLTSPAAAKLFKSIDLKTKTAGKIKFSELEKAITKAEATLSSGINLLENFERVEAERKRRNEARKPD